MKEFDITFLGRLNTSIGITYHIVEKVRADSEEAAILKLYDNYEHIWVKEISSYEVEDGK